MKDFNWIDVVGLIALPFGVLFLAAQEWWLGGAILGFVFWRIAKPFVEFLRRR